MSQRRIGQILVDLGFLTDDQLQIVLEEQEQQPGSLFGKVAEDMQLVTDEQLIQGLAEQMGMQTVSLEEAKIDPEVLERISETMAQLYRCVPVQFDEAANLLTIATCDPQNLNIQDELRTFLGHDIRVVVATERDVNTTITKHYDSEAESVEKLVAELAEDEELKAAVSVLDQEKFSITDAAALADSAPVRKLLNMVLLLAIKDHASDIHFEPFEDEFRIRIKSEGVLYEMVPPPRHLAFAITTRIKVMADLDIAERRMPQDGRIELMVGGHPVDLRVSVLPTIFGESTVMRVLDRSVVDLSLDNVGMDPTTIANFRKAIDRPNGIILVTGPTGSGKTTTLYSSLSELNDPKEKIITTEDPVEYDIDGIIQIPIDSNAGVTFASCLRAILRQDPDIILVGEIRDLETAEIAIQAALTGHLVFSTLHTNDSPSTVTRLTDMGIQPFMICATVEAILAQRLVRRICTKCREKTRVSTDLLMELGLNREEVEETDYFKGTGCENCNNTGYKGRIALFELMVMNDAIREMIMSGDSTDDLRDKAQADGMITLRDYGMQVAREGITTLDEIVRETVVDG
ncbi:type IV pilus assembly protein PilB [Rhodopirellula rubra]|uniref:Type IV pilus assembly protein PilB n=1 Tax=Aporhodopirellula rubra TaxID=980271 RepID=A0A7W5DU35_9BACT|nr:ATPase, T2SS/T4P/T4SS family [Aporhodopirellula rubra]MBB3204585.1 type IV pilus assembly protein PilB [Aporhodopirellula rubra]